MTKPSWPARWLAGASLIGVNNRDLKTFKVDLATTERLAGRLRDSSGGGGKLLVAESGINTRADVERLERCGARAILVGESLMRQGSVAVKVGELLGIKNSKWGRGTGWDLWGSMGPDGIEDEVEGLPWHNGHSW